MESPRYPPKAFAKFVWLPSFRWWMVVVRVDRDGHAALLLYSASVERHCPDYLQLEWEK